MERDFERKGPRPRASLKTPPNGIFRNVTGVRLVGVTKKFGPVIAVDNLSLEVQPGTFTVLVGPSGCGKTTVLRLIAGLEEATSGDIFIGEQRVNEVPPKDRDIAMVFQSYALYPHMNVYENMAFGLRVRQLKSLLWRTIHWKQAGKIRETINQRVRETAQLLNLEQLLHRRPSELSGGQRQRVALGRALVREPKVFLMDEPLSNLDAKLRVQMRAELIRLHRRLGVTTLYVTHDQTEAMTMGQRIAVMKDGVLQQYDTPEAIYRHPVNTFVATFIGTPPMNLIEAPVQNGAVVLAGSSLPLPCKANPSRVILGIRPESFRPAPPGIPFPLKVDVVELLGATKTVYLQGEWGPMTAILPHDAPSPEGEPLTLYVKEGDFHFFDPHSSQALR